jgi:hypothetical protein
METSNNTEIDGKLTTVYLKFEALKSKNVKFGWKKLTSGSVDYDKEYLDIKPVIALLSVNISGHANFDYFTPKPSDGTVITNVVMDQFIMPQPRAV